MIKFLFDLFSKKKQAIPEQIQEVKPNVSKVIDQPIKIDSVPKSYITIEDVITASGKYRSRASSPELTTEVMENISKLVKAVNALFNDLQYPKNLKISSGFRPSSVNAGIKGAAKRSAHMIGMALDLEDVDGSIDALLDTADSDILLKKYGLWLEHPDATKTWCHLDMRDRGKRAANVFRP